MLNRHIYITCHNQHALIFLCVPLLPGTRHPSPPHLPPPTPELVGAPRDPCRSATPSPLSAELCIDICCHVTYFGVVLSSIRLLCFTSFHCCQLSRHCDPIDHQ